MIENATLLSRPIILPKSYDPRITVKPADRNRDDTPTVLPVAPKSGSALRQAPLKDRLFWGRAWLTRRTGR